MAGSAKTWIFSSKKCNRKENPNIEILRIEILFSHKNKAIFPN